MTQGMGLGRCQGMSRPVRIVTAAVVARASLSADRNPFDRNDSRYRLIRRLAVLDERDHAVGDR
jgi:hypothetical protein